MDALYLKHSGFSTNNVGVAVGCLQVNRAKEMEWPKCNLETYLLLSDDD